MILAELQETERQWRERIEALIAAGWGDVEQDQIPANWQEIPGPDRSHSAELKAAAKAGLIAKWEQRHRAPHKSLKAGRSEEMRAKNADAIKRREKAKKAWNTRRGR